MFVTTVTASKMNVSKGISDLFLSRGWPDSQYVKWSSDISTAAVRNVTANQIILDQHDQTLDFAALSNYISCDTTTRRPSPENVEAHRNTFYTRNS